MFVHALSGAASFAACLRLFRSYPLAVSPWSADGGHRSIVLRYPAAEEERASGKNGFFILSQDTAEHFVLQPWPGGESADSDRPGQPGGVHVSGNPPSRPGSRRRPPGDRRGHAGPARRRAARLGQRPAGDGAALGLPREAGQPAAGRAADPGAAAGRQRAAALARVHRQPARRRAAVGVPGPGRTGRPRPGISAAPDHGFWVPSQNQRRASRAHGCVVMRRSLPATEFWLPAGVYMDHWMLSEGVPAPPASHLLGLPGTIDLARRVTLTEVA